jgi:hypothetical protein
MGGAAIKRREEGILAFVDQHFGRGEGGEDIFYLR